MNKRQSGIIISYVYTFVRVFVNLLYVPLLISGIGRSEYGLYQTIGSVIAYLNIINSTLSSGATRYYCEYHVLNDEDGKANTLAILRNIYRVAGIIILLVAIVLCFIIKHVYKNAFTQWELEESCIMVIVLALNLIVTMNNSISIACITANEGFVFLKGSMLISTLLQPLVVMLIIKEFPFALAVTLAQLIVNALLRMTQQRYAVRKLGMVVEQHCEDSGLRKSILTFSGAVILGAIADQIFWKADQLILAFIYGTSTVAVYGVGSQIVMIYMSIGVEVSSVFMPRISQLWHKDKDMSAITDIFIRVGRIAALILLLVLSGFIIFGKDFILLWVGKGFGEAYYIAIIIMIPFTLDICQHIGLTILQVIGKYDFRARLYVLAALLNIGITVFLSQRYGCVGAAFSTALAMLVSSGLILNWYYANKIGLDIEAFWKSIIRLAIPIIILCVICFYIQRLIILYVPINWPILLLEIAVFTVLYIAIAIVFSVDNNEREYINVGWHAIFGRISNRVSSK